MELNEDADFVESAWDIGMVWGFSGQLQYSELFYGFYTNDTYRSMAKFGGTDDSKGKVNFTVKKLGFFCFIRIPNTVGLSCVHSWWSGTKLFYFTKRNDEKFTVGRVNR